MTVWSGEGWIWIILLLWIGFTGLNTCHSQLRFKFSLSTLSNCHQLTHTQHQLILSSSNHIVYINLVHPLKLLSTQIGLMEDDFSRWFFWILPVLNFCNHWSCVCTCICIVVSVNQPLLCRQYPNELNIIPASVVIRINHLHLLTNYTTPHIYHSLLSCLHSSFCIASVRDNWNILNRSITPVMRPSNILD